MKKIREYFAFTNVKYMVRSQIALVIIFFIALITAYVSLELGGRTNFAISDWSLITCTVSVLLIGFFQIKRDSL